MRKDLIGTLIHIAYADPTDDDIARVRGQWEWVKGRSPKSYGDFSFTQRLYTSRFKPSGTKVDPTTTLPSPCGACLNSV